MHLCHYAVSRGFHEESVKYKIYNIGNNQPENLLDFVEILQDELKAAETKS